MDAFIEHPVADEKEEMLAEIATLQSQLKTLEQENDELKKALNMEEAWSQFHPKIPYKWKYEQQYIRGKRQGNFIKQILFENKMLKEALTTPHNAPD